MNHRQENLLQTMRRMEQHIETHPEFSPFIGTTGHDALTALITELAGQAAAQEAGAIASRGESVRAKRLRATLFKSYLRPIVAAARICAARNPALKAVKMPRARLRMLALLPVADGMMEVLQRHQAELMDAGLRQTFLADASAVIAQLREALDDRARQVVRRAGATKRLTVAERRARRVIKIVDAQIRFLIGDDNAALLAEWKTAVRVARNPGVRARSPRASAEVAA